MIEIRKKIIKFKKSNDAVVGIFVAVLFIGLIFAVIATVQTVYIPKWMEQKEADHMDSVENQFAQLKSAIDTQSLSKQRIPISTSIPLGSKELPFLSSMRSYGSLDIMINDYKISITNDTNTFSYTVSTIRYSSNNAYFLDQSYIYENGALILSQPLGSTMFINPSFIVDKNIDVDALFYIVKISGIGEKTSVSGYGSCPIKTIFSSSSNITIPNVETISINSTYQNVWKIFLENTLKRSGLNYGSDFISTSNDDEITVQFTGSNVNLDLEFLKIDAQLSPGWVEW